MQKNNLDMPLSLKFTLKNRFKIVLITQRQLNLMLIDKCQKMQLKFIFFLRDLSELKKGIK